MPEWKEELQAAARERWHTRSGVAIAMVLVAIVLVGAFAGVDIEEISLVEWLIVVFICVGIWAIWHKTRLPRAPKGKVGFGIAIEFEDSEHAKRLRSDFIDALRDLLTTSGLRHDFAFIEFPQSVARTLRDDPSQLDWIVRRSNLRFLALGRARFRPLPSGPTHVIDLRCFVRHVPLDRERAGRFGEDFSRVMPGRIFVGAEADIILLEFAAKHVDAVARYVIGTAAALSNDFVYAEQLLLDSEAKLQQYVQQVEGAPLSVLLARVRNRLGELYAEWMQRLVLRYTFTRDVEPLRQLELVIASLRRYEPEHYGARLAADTAAFVLRRDVVVARNEVDACRRSEDATWMYSEAFLHAYDGDLENAYRSYRRAFQSPLSDPTIPTQCEEFIQIVLDEERVRTWLYYCLGLINYRAKGDLEAARRDFDRFVTNVDPVRFQRHIGIATKWIQEIDAVLPATASSQT